MNKISVSILDCDFNNIEYEIKRINKSKADLIHIDIMDGVFVKRNTYELFDMKTISSLSNKKLDIHLMVDNPEIIIDNYILDETDFIAIHVESNCDHFKIFNKLKSNNIKTGIAINPDTDLTIIEKYLDYLDMILVMSVYPGKGGQKFIPNTISRLVSLKKLLTKKSKNIKLSVDGGVDDSVSSKLIESGSDILVSGSFLIKSKNLKKSIKSLLKA